MLKPRKANKQKLNKLLRALPYGASCLTEAVSLSKSVTNHKRFKRLVKRFGSDRDWSRAVPLMIGVKVPLITTNGRDLNSVHLVKDKSEIPNMYLHLWDEHQGKVTKK